MPSTPTAQYAYKDVMVISSRQPGIPLPHAKLAKGSQQIVVIPDESQLNVAQEDWQRLGQNVQFINLDLPAVDFVYHYRLMATIAMAEIARQVGRKPRRLEFERSEPRIIYRQAIRTTLEARGELIYLEDLEDY